jgi:hypothetical protein
MSTARIQSLPHLSPGEVSLLDLAADDPRDVVTLSDKEALILQLYNQIQELELEKALLVQGTRQYNFFFVSLIYLFGPSKSVSPGY